MPKNNFEQEREDNEREDSSQIQGNDNQMRVWKRDGSRFHKIGYQCGNMFQMPPVFYR